MKFWDKVNKFFSQNYALWVVYTSIVILLLGVVAIFYIFGVCFKEFCGNYWARWQWEWRGLLDFISEDTYKFNRKEHWRDD